MKEVIYAKYNSLRVPSLRVSTEIIEDGCAKYVFKRPMEEAAKKHVFSMAENRQKLLASYDSVIPVQCRIEGDGIAFEYVDGTPVLTEEEITACDRTTLRICLQSALIRVISYKGEEVAFSQSKEFVNVFGPCNLAGLTAYPVINYDSNLDNFIISGGNVVCIDYEWVFNFQVPTRLVWYRALVFFYMKHEGFLRKFFTKDMMLKNFGLTDEEISCFEQMEEHFQEYVHGRGHRYLYTRNYEKKEINIASAYDSFRLEDTLKDDHIRNLEAIKAKHERMVSEIKHSLRNPFYGGTALLKWAALKASIKDSRFIPASLKTRIVLEADAEKYDSWIRAREAGERYDRSYTYQPKISVLVPVYNVPTFMLCQCVDSVLNQVYKNWELVLVDDCSTMKSVRPTLHNYSQKDARVKVILRRKNGNISRATNTALKRASGEFIAFMDCDDTITPDALYQVVGQLNRNRDIDFIYSDEDKIDEKGNIRYDPFFKPGWSPDTFMSLNYTSHLSVFRRSVAIETGGLRVGFEGAQDYDFTLRFLEHTSWEKIAHIPKVLYHWRARKGSAADRLDAKGYARGAAFKAKEGSLRRRGIEGTLEWLDEVFQYRVRYKVTGREKVSVIIPSKDHYDYLKRCISSLKTLTNYQNYEIIVVDNGSGVQTRKLVQELLKATGRGKYLYKEADFNFSAMCNAGASEADGDYLLFLNDDTIVTEGSWMDRMLGQAIQEWTGAVGAKLLYPNGDLIQHVGIIDSGNGPIAVYAHYPDTVIYPFCRNRCDYNYIAVTGACLMVSAAKFSSVGMFDEKDLAVAFNDVDLCMKLYESGYYNVLRNDVVLLHDESASRGSDEADGEKRMRYASEMRSLYAHHPSLAHRDPFYNPNLSQFVADFSIDYNS